jgi:hypothetical protein
MSKQLLKDGRIQYHNAYINMHTGNLFAYGDDVTLPNRSDDIWYYDCVEKRPNCDGYYESHWVYNKDEIA